MMNAYRKQGCPLNLLWYKFPRLLKKQVLNRELTIVQAIVDTRRESNSEINVEFEQCLLRTTFNGYPLIGNRSRDEYRNETISNRGRIYT